MNESTASIKGRYLRHSPVAGFLYEYTCEACKKTFQSRAYELSAPVLCHNCFYHCPSKERKEYDRTTS